MKRTNLLFTVILLLSILSNCKNNDGKGKTRINVDKTQNVTNDTLQKKKKEIATQKYIKKEYDYNPKNFLLEIIDDLNKYPNEQGIIISNFLDHYNKIIQKYNNEKYSKINKNPESFNEYFSYIQTEGDYMLAEKPNYILEINDYIKPKFKAFLKAYSMESDKPALDDAYITINFDELINRAYIWGEFTKKINEKKLKEIAKNNFNYYLELIFFGSDNSPVFDYETNKYNEKLYNLMLRTTIKYPNAVVSKNFKDYAKILEKNDLKKSKEIENYKIK